MSEHWWEYVWLIIVRLRPYPALLDHSAGLFRTTDTWLPLSATLSSVKPPSTHLTRPSVYTTASGSCIVGFLIAVSALMVVQAADHRSSTIAAHNTTGLLSKRAWVREEWRPWVGGEGVGELERERSGRGACMFVWSPTWLQLTKLITT